MELYIPIERPQRNPVNGRFLKGRVPHNKGKKWGEWMDMRKARRIRRIAMGNLKPNYNLPGWNKKAVIAMDDDGNVVGWFESTMDAERKVRVSSTNISKVCRGKRKYAGGFRWEYV